MRKCLKQFENRRRGMMLVTTMILLVVMTTLGYMVSSKVLSLRHRNNYLIDYQRACYARDSARRFMTENMELIDINAVIRVNEPDFSDVFALSEEQYQGLLKSWGMEPDLDSDRYDEFTDMNDPNGQYGMDSNLPGFSDEMGIGGYDDMYGMDPNQPVSEGDVNSVSLADLMAAYGEDEQEEVGVRGPYGAKWPLAVEPIILEIGDAEVTIEIHDENAKYPLTWLLMKNDEIEREILYSFRIFCDWMGITEGEAEEILEQLYYIDSIKEYKNEYKPITVGSINRGKNKSGKKNIGRRTKPNALRLSANDQLAAFVELLHSPALDREILSRSTIESESRDESALKYISMWGTEKVNINSAPRHVLEAAFAFGGYEVKIADEIIEWRKTEPFEDIGDLKKKLFRYNTSIEKSEPFITTSSDVFTIRVKANCGVAVSESVVGIKKTKSKVVKIAKISG